MFLTFNFKITMRLHVIFIGSKSFEGDAWLFKLKMSRLSTYISTRFSRFFFSFRCRPPLLADRRRRQNLLIFRSKIDHSLYVTVNRNDDDATSSLEQREFMVILDQAELKNRGEIFHSGRKTEPD